MVNYYSIVKENTNFSEDLLRLVCDGIKWEEIKHKVVYFDKKTFYICSKKETVDIEILYKNKKDCVL